MSSPVNSGSGAGLLSSSTTATKWAYQVVSIDPEGVYEFAGYLKPESGISSSYLRISWYASADGSGTALGNVDSTSRVSASESYVLLSSGAVSAPPSARSARARVMLDPAGAAPATLYFDDLDFGPADAPPRAVILLPPDPDPVDDGPALAVAVEVPGAATSTTRSAPDRMEVAAGVSASSPVAEVQQALSTPTGDSRLVAPVSLEQSEGDGFPLTTVGLLTLLFVAGAGGAVLLSKRL